MRALHLRVASELRSKIHLCGIEHSEVARRAARRVMTSGFRRSRCEVPQDPPLTFAMFTDANGSSPVIEAMRTAGIGLSTVEGLARWAEVKEVIDDARHGRLIQRDDEFKPVAINPHVWELKFPLSDPDFRLYIGEPTSAPGYIVALHFHVKDVVPGQTRQLQNAEIAIAINRFDLGERTNWAQLN